MSQKLPECILGTGRLRKWYGREREGDRQTDRQIGRGERERETCCHPVTVD